MGNDYLASDAAGVNPDFVTVLTACDGQRMTKRWYRDPAGNPTCDDYGLAKWFRYEPKPVRRFDDLATVFGSVRLQSCPIYGKLMDGIDPDKAVRRLRPRRLKDGTIEPATIEDAGHYWLPLDADSIPATDANGDFNAIDHPERAVACLLQQLPAELRSADCLWQWTSSAGMKPGIRLRLFFWLSRKLTGAEVAAWLAPYVKSKANPRGILDGSIYTPCQPIYAAAPIFEGIPDPIAVRCGVRRAGGTVIVPAVLPAVRHIREASRAPSGSVVYDDPATIAWARDLIEHDLAEHGPPVVGDGSDPRTYKFVGCLRDGDRCGYTLDAETIVELLREHWAPDFEEDWLRAKGEGSYQNEPGCGPAGARYEHDDGRTGAETFAAYFQAQADGTTPPDDDEETLVDLVDDGDAEGVDVSTFGREGSVRPKPRCLAEDRIEAGGFVLLTGWNGVHKTRGQLQFGLALQFDRSLIDLRQKRGCAHNGMDEQAHELPAPWFPNIDIGAIEYLNYENATEEMDRRIYDMRRAGNLIGAEEKAAFRIHNLKDQRKPPLLEVWPSHMGLYGYVPARITLTPFGRKMLRRWRAMKHDRHMVIFLDSVNNRAVHFQGNTKVDDDVVERLETIFSGWCSELNATIIGSLNQSRAGKERGDVGNSAQWEHAPRQVLLQSRVTTGRDKKPTGKFSLVLMKSNNLRDGVGVEFEYYAPGMLLGVKEIDDQKEETDWAARAGEIVLQETYGTDDLKCLRSGTLTDAERLKIEQSHKTRLARHPTLAWTWGGKPLKIDTLLVQDFHCGSNLPSARVALERFVRGCDEALRRGLLDYRKNSENTTRAQRCPAGCCLPMPEPANSDEPEY